MATTMEQVPIRMSVEDRADLDEISKYYNLGGRSATMRWLIRQEIRRIKGQASSAPADVTPSASDPTDQDETQQSGNDGWVLPPDDGED